jgi:hypothetical protein
MNLRAINLLALRLSEANRPRIITTLHRPANTALLNLGLPFGG